MDHTSDTGNTSSETNKAIHPSRSDLLSGGAKRIFNKSSLFHPQQVFTTRLKAAEQRANPDAMSTTASSNSNSNSNNGNPATTTSGSVKTGESQGL